MGGDAGRRAQVVSLDISGMVLVWEFADGRVSFRFKAACASDDGREVDLTCATLDAGQREVLVGSANGRVLAHNFNNGVLHNRYLCGTGSPVLALRVSDSEEKRGGMLFASTLDGYVWMWVSAPMHRPGPVQYEKRFRLPPDRPDFDMDVVSLAHHRSGLLATGRQDGRVLVWNTVDGRLKRDLVDDLFARIDIDGSGNLTYSEVAEYLRDQQYTQEAIDDFFRHADRDDSREISREEFRAELARRGTLAIDPLTGNRLTKRDQQVELVLFLEAGGVLLLLAVTGDGTVTVFNADSGAFLRTLALPYGKRRDALTCFGVDEAEGLLLTGDCVGMVKAYDINQLWGGAAGAPVQINLLTAWKAHFEAVNALTMVLSSLAVVSSNGGPEPRILVWTYGGELIGVAGDRYSRMWAVPAEPDRGLPTRLRIAAMQAALQEGERSRGGEEGVGGGRDGPRHSAATAAQRRRRMERRMSTMQNAAYAVVNKKFLDRAVARRAELEVRQKRMRLFFKLYQHHFADTPGLVQSFEAHMEAIWGAEIDENDVNLKISQRHTKNVKLRLPEIAKLIDKAIGVQAEFKLEMDRLEQLADDLQAGRGQQVVHVGHPARQGLQWPHPRPAGLRHSPRPQPSHPATQTNRCATRTPLRPPCCSLVRLLLSSCSWERAEQAARQRGP